MTDDLASLQARVRELDGRVSALKLAAEPLIVRALRWSLAGDSARLSVPLYELRALARAAGIKTEVEG